MTKVAGILLLLAACLHTSQGDSNWLFRQNTCDHLWGYVLAPVNPNCYNNPNVKSDMPTMITRSKYKVELHTVITSDGYVLRLFRIPAEGKQPCYLQHGIATNGHVFVDKDERSLAFHLAEKGFDVWIGTVRGSTYGSTHLNLSRNDNEFWDFKLDDHVEKDLPATLTYVAKVTGKAGEIIYIGHSMGTSIMFMFASSQPEKAQRLLKGVIAMSPVAYLDKNFFVKAISPFSGAVRSLLKLIGVRALYKSDTQYQSTLNVVCRYVPFLCVGALDIVFGKDPKQFKAEDLLLYFSSWPVSASVDEHIQFLQIANKERFQKFDYGDKNQEIYKQALPPQYDLSKVTVPMFLFYGKNDAVCPVENVQRLFGELGSKKKLLIHISKDGEAPFNHISFEYAKDADTLLYPELLKVINENLATNPSSETQKPNSGTTTGSKRPISQTKPEGASEVKNDLKELKPGGGNVDDDKDSDESKKGSDESKNGSDESKNGSDESKNGSDESKKGSDESKKGSDESKKGSDESKKGSDESKNGSDESKKGSDEGKKGSDEGKNDSDEGKENSDSEEDKDKPSDSRQPISQTKPEGASEVISGLKELKPGGGNVDEDDIFNS